MEQSPLDSTTTLPDSGNIENKKPSTLIMKGGGIKGLAYIGALEILVQNGYKFNWYAGTSAGAISAILLAAGYTHKELEEILYKKDFNEFKDAGFFKRIWNLFSKGGLYEAEAFTNWIDRLLAKKFESPVQVHMGELMEITRNRVSVYASRIEAKVQVFDSALPESTKTPVSFAARSSMAIPFFFTPTMVNGYVTRDGGMQNNYPVNALLQDNPDTKFIGFFLGPEFFEPAKKKGLIANLIAIWMQANDQDALRAYKNETIIIDPRPISTLDFKLTTEEKEFLLEGGRLSALKFLSKRNENSLPKDFEERKKRHEEIREKLIKKRIRKKRIRMIAWIFSASILILLAIYFKDAKHFVLNLFPSYRTSIAYSIGLESEYLNPRDSLFRYTPGELVNNSDFFDQYGPPCSYLPAYFTSIPNYKADLISSIKKSDKEVTIIFHFTADNSKYSGFKFSISGLAIDYTKIDQKMWYPFSCDNSNPQQFLLRESIKRETILLKRN